MYDRILVPLDGSDASTAVLRHAVSIATDTDATVHILTVVEPERSPLAFGVEEVGQLSTAVEDLLASVQTGFETGDVPFDIEVRRGESPHEVILDYADEIEVDMIVLGRRGASSLPDRIFGSTVDRIARLSTVPVFLVPIDAEEA
jgi:nucleotide-binding universal stress UspA family protein